MENSSIEWTDATWNPVTGCTVQSAGCTNCYAINMTARLERMGIKKYKNLTRRSGKRVVWTGDIRMHNDALNLPLKWKKPKKIFVNSMSDLFHEEVTEQFIRNVWDIMQQTPQHIYQILTKRPDRMNEITNKFDFPPLSNVWLGTSVEDKRVASRITDLKQSSAAIRFISFEPLIGSVGKLDLESIDWAIVGGESGHRARKIRKQWIDEIHDQCMKQEVAFFFKQWGTWGSDSKKRSKKQNGRIYRGREWNESPDY